MFHVGQIRYQDQATSYFVVNSVQCFASTCGHSILCMFRLGESLWRFYTSELPNSWALDANCISAWFCARDLHKLYTLRSIGENIMRSRYATRIQNQCL